LGAEHLNPSGFKTNLIFGVCYNLCQQFLCKKPVLGDFLEVLTNKKWPPGVDPGGHPLVDKIYVRVGM
jgi:hypothetical protein